jgi:hypothetical protein
MGQDYPGNPRLLHASGNRVEEDCFVIHSTASIIAKIIRVTRRLFHAWVIGLMRIASDTNQQLDTGQDYQYIMVVPYRIARERAIA